MTWELTISRKLGYHPVERQLALKMATRVFLSKDINGDKKLCDLDTQASRPTMA